MIERGREREDEEGSGGHRRDLHISRPGRGRGWSQIH
jgi:hypothetical protein